MGERPGVFRVGAVSYLRIPSDDPPRSAAFYAVARRYRRTPIRRALDAVMTALLRRGAGRRASGC